MAGVATEKRGGVAILTLDNPPVNGLGAAVRQGFGTALDRVERDAAVTAVVIHGAGSIFSAGADIREFNTPAMSVDPSLPDLCNRVELMAKPVIAALHGTAAGGGLELALACHYRIAARGARLGLPEVKLGIVPGAGGTQRLPRLAGLAAAVELITRGDLVFAERALELGIVDRVSEGDVLHAAVAFAESGPPPRRTRDAERHVKDAADPNAFTRFRADVQKRARGQFSPLACLDCIEASVTKPFEQGLAFERATFRACVESDQSRALRYAFFAERAAAKVSDLPPGLAPRPISRAGVLGAGTMGVGIAMTFANAGIPVTLIDANDDALRRGIDTVRDTYRSAAARGRMKAAEAAQRAERIASASSLADLADADIVIEAVFEDMALKQGLFRDLDQAARPDALLATNTSTLDVDEIAAVTNTPERVLGLHFFSPANVMPLLEVVRGARTSAATLSTAMALAKRLGKVAVVVGVCDGFVGNRMLDHYIRQAGLLLEEGALPQDVDAAMQAFGFAMGPFAMQDLAGIDVGWRVRKERMKRKPETTPHSVVGERLCERGRFGQKTGKGWYRYGGGRAPEPDQEVETLIRAVSAERGIERRTIGPQEIVERCLYPMVNEAALILSEGIAQRASDVDVVWLNGYAFPRHRGGPLFHADEVGLDRVLAVIERLAADPRNGVRPAPLLVELARGGRRFADL